MQTESENTVSITKGGMTVLLERSFPRVLEYQKNELCMKGDFKKDCGLMINGTRYEPVVSCEKTAEDQVCYTLAVPELEASVALCYKAEPDRLKINVTELHEGRIGIRTIGLENEVLLSICAKQADTSAAVVSNPEKWKSIQDEIAEEITSLKPGVTEHIYAMLSADGLAATLNSTSIRNGARIRRFVAEEEEGTIVGIGNNDFDYRMPDDTLQPLPATVVLLCEDYNGDGKTDWKDAAAAYRKIRTAPKGAEEIKNHMMWIAYNSASQVQEPFFKTLDMAKAVFNYTDGFGQMIMHKGYQGEGHDDSHGDYGGNIGLRQGGKDALKQVIEAGKKYNVLSGVHINVNEHMPDARSFSKDVLKDPCEPGWNFFDQAYFIDQTKDILSGNRRKNLLALKRDLPQLDFVYVDIYGIDDPNDWQSSDLIRTLHECGWIIGTEFSGPMERGTAFTHWGHDIAYPNESNESRIMKYFKNDYDIFLADALTMGSVMLPIASWEHRCDMYQGIGLFYNHTLITKYLQHHDIMDYEDDFVQFTDGVRTQRRGDKIVLTKCGRRMAEWFWSACVVDPGQPTERVQESTGDAVLFIPWFSEESQTRNPDDADKIYHWNAQGGTTTWEVPESWKNEVSAELYRLSRSAKTRVGSVAIKDGKITLTAEKSTPYVLYKAGSAPRVAGNFGEGTPLCNPGFDAPDLSMWNPHTENASMETTFSAKGDPRLTMTGFGKGTAEISQDMKELQGGRTYTVYLYADIARNAQLKIEVSCGGKSVSGTYTKAKAPCYNIARYAGTFYQKVKATFDVPEMENKAKLTLTGCFDPDGGTVNLSDIRVWQNETRSVQITDAGYEDYVVYEDFENVEQGFGCFVPAGNEGSSWDFRAHIAEKAEGSQQYLDYVVNGRHSLKINQSGEQKQTLLRTDPNTVTLLADTEYDLAFGYITGVTGRHALRIKNRAGDIAYEYRFEDTGLEAGTHSLASRFVSDTFTTGSSDDYYLAIDLIDPSVTAKPQPLEFGSEEERIVLSIDDVIIKRHRRYAE